MKLAFALSALTLLLLPAAIAQPAKTLYLRDLCVKARDGKYSELRTFLLDTATKTARYRVQAGTYTAFILTEGVAPAGREARCDFHLVYGSPGFPAEQTAATTEELQKAGVSMSLEQRNARRDALSYLVATDYWAVRDFVGETVKGGYARVNYYKVKPGMATDWVNAEKSGWKQLAEVFARETPGRGWGLYSLAMPMGAALPYNAMTVDTMPDWTSLGAGTRPRQTWIKVHPESDYSAYMDKVGSMAERHQVDTVRILEVIRRP